MSKITQKYQKLSEMKQKEEEKKVETGMSFSPCLACEKEIKEGFYGRWGEGGVCSKNCNTIQSTKPRFPSLEDSQLKGS